VEVGAHVREAVQGRVVPEVREPVEPVVDELVEMFFRLRGAALDPAHPLHAPVDVEPREEFLDGLVAQVDELEPGGRTRGPGAARAGSFGKAGELRQGNPRLLPFQDPRDVDPEGGFLRLPFIEGDEKFGEEPLDLGTEGRSGVVLLR
jgi:hypothetical protein